MLMTNMISMSGSHALHTCRTVFEEPVGGNSADTFILSEDGQTLTMVSDYTRASTGRSLSYATVYRRQK